MFISVKIEILKVYSIFIWFKLNNTLKIKNEKIKMLLETFDDANLINVQKDDD